MPGSYKLWAGTQPKVDELFGCVDVSPTGPQSVAAHVLSLRPPPAPHTQLQLWRSRYEARQAAAKDAAAAQRELERERAPILTAEAREMARLPRGSGEDGMDCAPRVGDGVLQRLSVQCIPMMVASGTPRGMMGSLGLNTQFA